MGEEANDGTPPPRQSAGRGTGYTTDRYKKSAQTRAEREERERRENEQLWRETTGQQQK